MGFVVGVADDRVNNGQRQPHSSLRGCVGGSSDTRRSVRRGPTKSVGLTGRIDGEAVREVSARAMPLTAGRQSPGRGRIRCRPCRSTQHAGGSRSSRDRDGGLRRADTARNPASAARPASLDRRGRSDRPPSLPRKSALARTASLPSFRPATRHAGVSTWRDAMIQDPGNEMIPAESARRAAEYRRRAQEAAVRAWAVLSQQT
jgi:hypothetical protein